MGFLQSVVADVIAAVLAAGVLGLLGWLGARMFRRRREERDTEGERGRRPRPLRVLVALPRPLLTLLREEAGEWVAATDWDVTGGAHRVLPLRRAWKAEAIERALRASGAPLEVRFLHHPTESELRGALGEDEGTDVLVVDTHGDRDGTLYFEGPRGESHPLPPADLGRLLDGGSVQLALLSACHSAAACDALRGAGVPAVVGMAEGVPEDAARAYLEAFLAQLARGDSVGKAHERACDALRTRWSARPGEAELPQLVASRRQRRRRLVRPGTEGAYARLGEGPAPPAPRALAVQLRGRELDQVRVQRALLARPLPEDTSPLVTLAGFGGVGKTALALAVARWCWERAVFPGGVRFVPLIDLRVREGETLADRLLREFELAPPQVAPGEGEGAEYRVKVGALCASLAGDRRMLVLDNFETAWAEGTDGRHRALLAELRQRCPGLHLLVTCRRAPLGLAGEWVHWLRPLAEDPAVQVFCDRAEEVGGAVSGAERGTVAEICKLLDCVPLHVRLVASHARAERPASILAGLHDTGRRYGLTAADLADEPAHHQSQEVSFRYTYDRLGEAGKRLWPVLAAVFAGEPDRAAVRAVYGAGADAALDELLAWLVAEREDGRHRMAEAVREFGRARLAGLGLDEGELRARHAAHYLAVAREAFTVEKYQQAGWAAVEESDGPDIFAAADWAVAELERAKGAAVEDLLARWEELEAGREEVVPAGEWAYVLHNYVVRRQPPGGHRWLAGGLVAWRMSGAEETRARQALLCNEFGLIYDARGEYGAALGWYEKSVALTEELGDRAGLAATYNNIANIHYARGEYGAALGWYEKSVALQEELGNRAGLATSYNNIASVQYARGEYGAALGWYEKSVALTEELGDRAGLATSYNNIGLIYDARGEYGAALGWYEKSVALQEELGDRAGLAASYNNIGSLYFSQGDFERAFEWQKKALDIGVELGASGDLIFSYFNVGTDLLKLGRRLEATEYIRRAFELCDQLGLPHLAGQLVGALRSTDADIAEVQGWMGDTTAD